MAGKLLLLFLTASALGAGDATTPGNSLTEVFHDNDFQLTGVTVSKSGRLFVNYPRWSDHYLNAVVEVMPDGSAKPYPDEFWNRWDKKPATAGKQFVCIQSVVVDGTDALWVLDPAVPLQAAVVPGGPKLVKIDLKANTVSRIIPFGSDVVKPGTYLNDVRFDTANNTAYITDSGVGGIVVVDLTSGKAHRCLDGHPSVKAESGMDIVINGKPVRGVTGKPPMFNSDGIALSPDGRYLYYQALTGATLYRVETKALRGTGDPAASVEKVAKTFPVDGIWMDSKQRIYLSNLNQNSIARLLPNGTLETIVSDPRLQWPDTFTEDHNGNIYITTSHIHETPSYNQGKSVRKLPYSVFRFKP